jgi:hypothetical protein
MNGIDPPPTFIPQSYPLQLPFSAGLLGCCLRDPLSLDVSSYFPFTQYTIVTTSAIPEAVPSVPGRVGCTVYRRIRNYQELLDRVPQQNIRRLLSIAERGTCFLYMVVCVITQTEVPFAPGGFNATGAARITIGEIHNPRAAVTDQPQVVWGVQSRK